MGKLLKLEKSDKTVLEALYEITSFLRRGFESSKILKAIHLDSGENIYTICFAFFYLFCFVDTSMIHYPQLVRLLCVGGVAVFHCLMWFKIIVLDTDDKWDIVRFVIPLAIGNGLAQMAQVYGGFRDVVFIYLFIAGARKINFRKPALVSLLLGVISMIVISVMSPMGYYTNLIYEMPGVRNRYAFGFIYPTDYAAHVCFFSLTYFWLRKGAMKWFDILLHGAAAAFIFYFCIAKIDTVCIVLVIVFGLLFRSAKCRSFLERHCKPLFILIMPVLAGITILLTLLYDENSGFYKFLNGHAESLYLRFRYGRRGFMNTSPRIFGKFYLETGNGGSTMSIPDEEYSFLDISYVRIWIKHGILSFVSILLWYPYMISRRLRKKDLVTAAVWFIIAINAAIAHHFIDFSYNIFLFMLLADLSMYDGCPKADTKRLKKHESAA